ncbi:hypothetical protein B6U99_05805 [Candidatus Geothermarchaeota archaeon ex4572_27]|nr:MAG: hypothetical protein B6U99_05805 [Candidatus Geothermarchaeota archaeon ex4572_27]
MVARREDRLLVAKAVEDIDRVPESTSVELRRIALALSATPLLVGARKGDREIEEGVVYERMGVRAVAPKTFDYAVRGEKPFVYSKVGRYYVKLDGEKLREVRTRMRLSLGDLARMVGVSRRAIYEYERGTMDATLEVAARIQEVLNCCLATPIDLLAPMERGEEVGEEWVDERPLMREVMCKLRRLGFEAYTFRRAPFNLIARGRRHRLMVKVAERLDRKAERSMVVVRSMADVSDSLSLAIVREEVRAEEQGLINYREFKRVRSEPELVKLIEG